MSNKKEIIIKATKLKKSFITGDTEQTIFENLDLNIYRGDFTVIMGSSGAGKSTLMYSLSGMDLSLIHILVLKTLVPGTIFLLELLRLLYV